MVDDVAMHTPFDCDPGEGPMEVPSRNHSLAHGSECAVDAHPPGASGFHDVFGNVWDWTEDAFNPLDGFQVHPVYDDFSTPCFDGEHHIIMGGSFASTGDAGASVFSRYHFRPHFQQHSGFRYVQSVETESAAPHITRLVSSKSECGASAASNTASPTAPVASNASSTASMDSLEHGRVTATSIADSPSSASAGATSASPGATGAAGDSAFATAASGSAADDGGGVAVVHRSRRTQEGVAMLDVLRARLAELSDLEEENEGLRAQLQERDQCIRELAGQLSRLLPPTPPIRTP